MASGLRSPDLLMMQQHHNAHHLLCLQKDKFGKYSIPDKLNPIIVTILKTGMKVTGPPMALNRALAHFAKNSRKLNNQHRTPFAIKQKYNKQAWTLFLHTA